MVQNKVLIIHCGGTLGMVQTVNGYGVKRDNLFKLIYNNEKLNHNCDNKASVEPENCMNEKKEIDCFDTDLLKKVKRANDSYIFYDYNFTLVHDKRTICYNLIELNDIIDSSLARLDDWHVILQIVGRFASDYDGFVIVHGTDTLSYASAFFYYMTSGVKIICTGAIEPMVVDKQEGENNIVNCLVNVNNVKCASVCFGNYIMAGNDAHKIETDSKNAFWSSKMKHLGGDVGCGQKNSIAKCTDCTKMPCTVGSVGEIAKEDQIIEQTIHTKFSDKIGLIKIYPGISSRIFEAFLTSYDAIIIETFGCGNGLTNNNDILDFIQKYTKSKVIVNVSQCLNGCINEMYEVNSKLARCGVISGGGLKTEAVFCLLAWALGNFNIENAKKMIIDQIKKE